MSCSEYDLQGLHARIYLARETDGRLGEYQCLSPTFRSSNAVYTALMLLRQIACFPLTGEQLGDQISASNCIYVLPLHALRLIGSC
jgi:hypothetical protein